MATRPLLRAPNIANLGIVANPITGLIEGNRQRSYSLNSFTGLI